LLVGAIVADFVWMFPLYTDITLSLHAWQQRMWFASWS
jgi:dolichyl-phosphate-mannose--protein O-mannosyl transferase